MEESKSGIPASKSALDSYSETTQIIRPPHINGSGRLFGGVLMQWINTLASIVAMRHSGHYVTTAAVDTLEFRGPAFQNELAVLEGRVTWTGRTSMEVWVDTWVEKFGVRERMINRAYLIMVAMDGDRPVPVPPLRLTTAEEREEWELALRRRKARLAAEQPHS